MPRPAARYESLCATDRGDGVDEAVKGMRVGETREVTLTPADAFGERTDEAILEAP